VRVVSTSPEITGSDNGHDIIINGNVSLKLILKAFPGNAIKKGTSVTFRLISKNKNLISNCKWQIKRNRCREFQTFTTPF